MMINQMGNLLYNPATKQLLGSSDFKLDTKHSSGPLFILPYRANDFFLYSEISDVSDPPFNLGQTVQLSPSHENYPSEKATIISVPVHRSEPFTLQTQSKDILQASQEDITPIEPSGKTSKEGPPVVHHPWLTHQGKITAQFPGMTDPKQGYLLKEDKQ